MSIDIYKEMPKKNYKFELIRWGKLVSISFSARLSKETVDKLINIFYTKGFWDNGIDEDLKLYLDESLKAYLDQHHIEYYNLKILTKNLKNDFEKNLFGTFNKYNYDKMAEYIGDSDVFYLLSNTEVELYDEYDDDVINLILAVKMEENTEDFYRKNFKIISQKYAFYDDDNPSGFIDIIEGDNITHTTLDSLLYPCRGNSDAEDDIADDYDEDEVDEENEDDFIPDLSYCRDIILKIDDISKIEQIINLKK